MDVTNLFRLISSFTRRFVSKNDLDVKPFKYLKKGKLFSENAGKKTSIVVHVVACPKRSDSRERSELGNVLFFAPQFPHYLNTLNALCVLRLYQSTICIQ